MRILLVCQYFWPEPFRVTDLAVSLQQLGHEVVVLTGTPNYPEGAVYPDFKREPQRYAEIEGVEVIRVPIWPRGTSSVSLALNYLSFAVTGSLLGAFKMRGRDFDIVLVYQLSPVTLAIPGVVIGILKRTKLALWVLDFWPDSLKAVGIRSPALFKVMSVVSKMIYKRCDLLFAQSRRIQARLSDVLSKQVIYLPSWTDLPGLSEPISPSYPKKTSDQFDIVFTGNLGAAQNLDVIVSAAKQVRHSLPAGKSIRWILVGDGRDAIRIQERVSQKNLVDLVLLPGRFPREQIPAILDRADALLLTLKDAEAFEMTVPAKLQTYLQAGKPILGAVAGESAEIIQASKAGKAVPPNDPGALAKAAVELASLTDSQRTEMGHAGRLFAASEFDRDMLLDRLQSYLVKMNVGKPGQGT